MARKELRPEDITAIIDTREQKPLDLSPLKCITLGRPTGDYTIQGLEHVISVERKGLQDFIGCIGYGRDRFEREMHRLLAYPARLLIIEGSLEQIALKQYRGTTDPTSVLGSALGWMAKGVPILFVRDHEECGKMVARFMFIAARRRWEECQAFRESLKISD